MIKVQTNRNAHGCIRSITVTGHAHYGEYGQDIVCAGVSALVQMIPIALVRILRTPVRFIQQSGRMWIRIPEMCETDSQKTAFLLEAVMSTIKEMQRTYEGFIEIVEKGRDNHV